MNKQTFIKAGTEIITLIILIVSVHMFLNTCNTNDVHSYNYPTHELLSPWMVVNAPESPCKKCGEHIFVAWILPPVNKQYLFDCNIVYLCAHCRDKKLHTTTSVITTAGGIEKLFNMDIKKE